MATIEQARRVLGEAEASLREMMEEALRGQRYGEVAEVARLADGLARLVAGGTVAAPAAANGAAEVWRASAGTDLVRPTRRIGSKRLGGWRRKGNYPHFVREVDRLVKIGWSKKHRAEYTHRAPWSAVEAFVRHLAGRVQEGKVFKVEDLLPVPDPATGADVPSYQVYLILAWLRQCGAATKKGRDGWLVRKGGLEGGRVEGWWEALA